MADDSPRAIRLGIATYLAFTLALSSIFYTLIIRAGHLAAAGGLYVVGLMWCPAASALLTCLVRRIPLRALGWRWPWRWVGLAWAIPVAYAVITYAVIWLTGLGGFPNTAPLAARFGAHAATRHTGAALFHYVLLVGTVGMLGSCLTALGEEIGWRGFLVPQLARTTSFTRTALISGAIWTLWHTPILLFADYNNGSGTPPWYGLLCFAVMVIGINFAFCWLRLRSGSLWTGMVMHGTHNLWIQAILTPLTLPTRWTPWVIDEFGCGLAIAAVVVALLVWRRRAAVEAPAAAVDTVPEPLVARGAVA